MNKDKQNQFIIRKDGSFQAYLGDVILKSVQVGDSEGWEFEAVASTPDKDRDGEVLMQKGLNFEPFIESGEFNWNHIPHAMVGVPIGKKAWFDVEKGSWHCQGIILKDMPIWEGYNSTMVVKQHNQLKKSGFERGLCTSVEGKVKKRDDENGKIVMEADIFNVALTFRPVNPSCTLTSLAKSLQGQMSFREDDAYYKSLSAGDVGSFTKEDLEGATTDNTVEGKLISHLIRKGYSKSDAKKYVKSYLRKKYSGL